MGKTIVVCVFYGRGDDLVHSNYQKMWLNQIRGIVKPAPIFYSYYDAVKEIKKGGVENLVIVEPDGEREIAEIEKLFPEINVIILTSNGKPKRIYLLSDWFLSSEQIAMALGG
jgi:hypothetical protein